MQFARILSPVLDLALPPRCPGCSAIVERDHGFCGECWAAMRFLGDPACARCGVPFETDLGRDALCGPCLMKPPHYDAMRAAVAYGPVARSVALRLKYGRRTGLAAAMARLMQRHVPPDADLIVPVPLHRWRLWSRGFNQAALIGAQIGRARGVAHDPMLLRRTRATPVLRGLDAGGRSRAVRGAFAGPAGAGQRLAGKHIVLIDDVHTSGATAGACARALKSMGAARVTVLCWARVLPGDADGDGE